MVGARIQELPDEDRAAIAAALPALGRLLTGLQEPAGTRRNDTSGGRE
jgi:hypothetical protein